MSSNQKINYKKEKMKTIKETVKETILKARQFHFEGKTPSDVDVEKLENVAIDEITHFVNTRVREASAKIIEELGKITT